MGLDLRVYATLPATAIDNAGNEIKSVLIEEFDDCFNFISKHVQEILDSNNKNEKYKELINVESNIYDSDFSDFITYFEKWIEKYKNWNIIFEGI